MTDLELAATSHDIDELTRWSRDPQLRHAVARNPSAPFSLLRLLLASHPHDVVANPSLPLLLLADPGCLRRLPTNSLTGLAMAREALGALLGWSPEPPWTELQLTLACVGATGHALGASNYETTLEHARMNLVRRALVPDDIAAHLAFDPSPAVRSLLAKLTKAPAAIEAMLEDPEQHCRLAHNPTLPLAYQWALATTGDVDVRRQLARNRNVTAAIMTWLARDPSPLVRSAVANAQRTPPAAWRALCWDDDLTVQRAARAAKRTAVNP